MSQKNEKVRKAPMYLNYSLEDVTETEHAIAEQIARLIAEHIGMPCVQELIAPLKLAFCNGIAHARLWQRLSSEDRKQIEEYYKSLIDEISGNSDDITLN